VQRGADAVVGFPFPEGRSDGSPLRQSSSWHRFSAWIALLRDDPTMVTSRSRRSILGSLAVGIALAAVTSASPGASQSSSPSGSAAAFDPSNLSITLEPVVSDLEQPVVVTGDRAGGLLVVEQVGRIVRVNADGSVEDQPFLDIADRVQAGGEQGLLGLALHPDYSDNGRFFVYYTRSSDQANVVSEFSATDGVGDPGSERVILEMPDFAANHNGGMLAFDLEGQLLIGTGDGGGAGDPERNGQNRETLLGKLLRIDVDSGDPYGIPDDNPFADDSGTRPEIYALGLRNPWRYSVDSATGDIWIGDVGQGSWEEIDVIPAGSPGLNFGWNIVEGPDCYQASDCDRSGFTAPVVSVSHDQGNCSIIGGYVYRGEQLPALAGGYLFTDYCTGRIQAIDPAQSLATGTAEPTEVGSYDGAISSWGTDDAGEPLALDHNGVLLRVVAAARS